MERKADTHYTGETDSLHSDRLGVERGYWAVYLHTVKTAMVVQNTSEAYDDA